MVSAAAEKGRRNATRPGGRKMSMQKQCDTTNKGKRKNNKKCCNYWGESRKIGDPGALRKRSVAASIAIADPTAKQEP